MVGRAEETTSRLVSAAVDVSGKDVPDRAALQFVPFEVDKRRRARVSHGGHHFCEKFEASFKGYACLLCHAAAAGAGAEGGH